MKQVLDRITEAYYGQMGDVFAKKVRERMHWICSKATGERILDIGCSQGIAAILLAREGKKVLGIDVHEESIKYAVENLNEEPENVKENVEFRVENFFNIHEDMGKFDSVILSEVLEHLTDPDRMLLKAKDFLKDQGQIVITVPFGINDFIDHKKTYYFLDLIDEIENAFYIKDVKFFGKWLGIVANSKSSDAQGKSVIDKQLLYDLEKNFYNVESELLEQTREKAKAIETLKERCAKLDNDLKSARIEIDNFKNDSERLKINNELESENLRLKVELDGIRKDSITLNSEIAVLKEMNLFLKELNAKFNEERNAAETRIVDLEENVKSLGGLNTVLNKEMSMMCNTREETILKLNSLTLELEQVRTENSDLKIKIGNLASESESYMKANVALDEENSKLRNEVEDIEKTSDELREGIEILRGVNSNLESVNISYKDKIYELNSEISTLVLIKDEKENREKELEQKLESLYKENSRFKEETLRFNNERLNFEKRHEELEFELELLKEEFEEVKTKADLIKSEKEEANNKQALLKLKMEALMEENASLSMEKANLSALAVDKDSRIDELEKFIERINYDLANKNNELIEHIGSEEKTLVEYRNTIYTISDLKAENENLKANLEEMKSKIEESTSTIKRLEEKNNFFKLEASEKDKTSTELSILNSNYKMQLENKSIELLQHIETEETTLKECKKVISEMARVKDRNSAIMRERDSIERRYEALRNSKLGKLTIRYWVVKKNLSNKFKKL